MPEHRRTLHSWILRRTVVLSAFTLLIIIWIKTAYHFDQFNKIIICINSTTEILSDAHLEKGREDSPLRIIIHAKHRTGGTYVSEFFNRNNQTFYIFEPLRLLERDGVITSQIEAAEYLAITHRCNFSRHFDRPVVKWWPLHMVCHPTPHTPGCPGPTQEAAEMACKKAGVVAIKEIRIDHLRYLDHLVKDNVKVIHLVRDPRGVVASRKPKLTGSQQDIYQLAYTYCHMAVLDAVHARKWAPSSYLLVRYEDMVLHPTRSMNSIYTFLGIAPGQTLESWIRLQEQLLIKRTRSSSRHETFHNTERSHPRSIPTRWRHVLTSDEVFTIQKACGPMMGMFGYNAVPDGENMTGPRLDLQHFFS